MGNTEAYLIEAKCGDRVWIVTNVDGSTKEYDKRSKAQGQITKLENGEKRNGRVAAGGKPITYRVYTVYY
jgi:hypothetical protein